MRTLIIYFLLLAFSTASCVNNKRTRSNQGFISRKSGCWLEKMVNGDTLFINFDVLGPATDWKENFYINKENDTLFCSYRIYGDCRGKKMHVVLTEKSQSLYCKFQLNLQMKEKADFEQCNSVHKYLLKLNNKKIKVKNYDCDLIDLLEDFRNSLPWC